MQELRAENGLRSSCAIYNPRGLAQRKGSEIQNQVRFQRRIFVLFHDLFDGVWTRLSMKIGGSGADGATEAGDKFRGEGVGGDTNAEGGGW